MHVCDETLSFACDHLFFTRPDGQYAARRVSPRNVGIGMTIVISLLIEQQVEALQTITHAIAKHGGVFADACGENQRIDATECYGE